MDSTYCLIVKGSLPATLASTLGHRLDDVRIWPGATRTSIECSVTDQAALRALLTQVWDVGCEVLLLADVTRRTSEQESP